MTLIIRGLPSDEVERLRHGAPDANGQPPLTRIAAGVANPCRHCLDLIAEGDQKLVLSYRPFDTLQPYAEAGPIFLHARGCTRYESDRLPPWFDFMDPAIVRGYDGDDWIRYDTGQVVTGPQIDATCRQILADASVAYVHVRSKFNCFQCRVERG